MRTGLREKLAGEGEDHQWNISVEWIGDRELAGKRSYVLGGTAGTGKRERYMLYSLLRGKFF